MPLLLHKGTTMSDIRYNLYSPSGLEVVIEGNLGSDPEVKTLDSGKSVLKLNVACSAGNKKDDSGAYVNATQWLNVNIWSSVPGADKVFGLVTNPVSEKTKVNKGNKIVISGAAIINSREYNGKIYTDIEIRDLYFFYKVMTGGVARPESESSSSLEDLPVGSSKEIIPF